MVTEIKSERLAAMTRTEGRPAMVLFFGDWCIDCRRLKPTWDAWTARRSGPIFAIEIQRGDPEWKDWRIDEIPTVAAFSGGREVGRAHGTISSHDLDRLWRLVSRERT